MFAQQHRTKLYIRLTGEKKRITESQSSMLYVFSRLLGNLDYALAGTSFPSLNARKYHFETGKFKQSVQHTFILQAQLTRLQTLNEVDIHAYLTASFVSAAAL